MSWPAFSWQEITNQARVAQLAERLQPAFDRTAASYTEALRLIGALLPALALSCGIVAVWRVGADLGVLDDFFISDGAFSHWQIWVALALGAQFGSVSINRRLKRAAVSRAAK